MNKNFLHNAIGNTLVVAGTLIRVSALNRYAEHGFPISPEQFIVLRLLVEEGDLYQRQICELLYKDRPNITRILNILEELNLITRNGHGNKKVITVTEEGKKMYDIILPVHLEERKSTIKGIDEKELRICVDVLEQIKKNLAEKVKLQI